MGGDGDNGRRGERKIYWPSPLACPVASNPSTVSLVTSFYVIQFILVQPRSLFEDEFV